MALRRRTGSRFETNAWAGFVDAMSALLLVMVFVLSIFMIMQFFLRETIRGQGQELMSLEGQLSDLATSLGATTEERDEAQSRSDSLAAQLSALQSQFDTQNQAIADFETQVAALIARNTELQDDVAGLRLAQAGLENDKANLESLRAGLESELEAEKARFAAQSEALSDSEKTAQALDAAQSALSKEQLERRLQEARAKALEEMVAEFESNREAADVGAIERSIEEVMALASIAGLDETFAQSEDGRLLRENLDRLNAQERAQLADQVATDYLREKLRNSQTELTAFTLALEEERQRAEDSLTLIAALEEERAAVEAGDLSDEAKKAALLEIANREIEARSAANAESERRLALLNQQTAQLRAQLQSIQTLIDAQIQADADAGIQLASLGENLNSALAKVAAEERARADNLEGYRSEFFGRMREIIAGLEGVEIVGDRFVFSSEVLFSPGSATLSEAGRAQIGEIASQVRALSDQIPSEINWILRVDGHTDKQPISVNRGFEDNWELSQARALSVVHFMINQYDVDPHRLAATGFGEFHPIDPGNSPEALARNRRIELKLTEQ